MTKLEIQRITEHGSPEEKHKAVATILKRGTIRDKVLAVVTDEAYSLRGIRFMDDEERHEMLYSVSDKFQDKWDRYYNIACLLSLQRISWVDLYRQAERTKETLKFITLIWDFAIADAMQYNCLIDKMKTDPVLRDLAPEAQERILKEIDGIEKYGEVFNFAKDEDGHYGVSARTLLHTLEEKKVISNIRTMIGQMKAIIVSVDLFLKKTNGYDFFPKDLEDIYEEMKDFIKDEDGVFSRFTDFDINEAKIKPDQFILNGLKNIFDL